MPVKKPVTIKDEIDGAADQGAVTLPILKFLAVKLVECTEARDIESLSRAYGNIAGANGVAEGAQAGWTLAATFQQARTDGAVAKERAAKATSKRKTPGE
jgi:hypothetical protein